MRITIHNGNPFNNNTRFGRMGNTGVWEAVMGSQQGSSPTTRHAAATRKMQAHSVAYA